MTTVAEPRTDLPTSVAEALERVRAVRPTLAALGPGIDADGASRECSCGRSSPTPTCRSRCRPGSPTRSSTRACAWATPCPSAARRARPPAAASRAASSSTARRRSPPTAAPAALQAEQVAARTAVAVSSDLFDLTGARSTAGARRLDRFWRNARTMAVHHSREATAALVGSFLLNGTLPPIADYIRL